MDERLMHFRVGVMVVATAVITLILLAAFGRFSWLFTKTYVIRVKFPQAPGVAVGTPVHKSGIRIGEVTDVEFTDNDEVLVTVRINSKYTIHDDEVCRLRTTLFGDTSLDFERQNRGDRPPAPRDASPSAKDTGHIETS